MPYTFPQSDLIFRHFIYFKLLWHPIPEPHVSAILCGGEEAGCGTTWDKVLVPAPNLPRIKIQVHSKCALRSAWLPSPTLHRGGVGLCPFPLRERTELSTNRDFPLSAKQTAQKDL